MGQKLQFSDRELQFSTQKIMGAQNCNFASKFSQSGGFLAPNLVFSEENFWAG